VAHIDCFVNVVADPAQRGRRHLQAAGLAARLQRKYQRLATAVSLAMSRAYAYGKMKFNPNGGCGVAPLLTTLKPFQKLPGSRACTFAETDAPALLPLPLQRYEMARFKTVKVHIDFHVELELLHCWSLPACWPCRSAPASSVT
jgi:hypothetical protein